MAAGPHIESGTCPLPTTPAPAGQGEHSHGLSTRLATEGQPAVLMPVDGWQPVLEHPGRVFFSQKALAFSDSGVHPNATLFAYKAAVSCLSSNSGLTVSRCSSKGACSGGYGGFRQRLCNAKK